MAPRKLSWHNLDTIDRDRKRCMSISLQVNGVKKRRLGPQGGSRFFKFEALEEDKFFKNHCEDKRTTCRKTGRNEKIQYLSSKKFKNSLLEVQKPSAYAY